MRLAARLLLASLVLSAPPVPAAFAADGTEPSPQATIVPEPTLWLRGPFGTVPSDSAGEPATDDGAAADDRPLDAFVRSAPLRLETGDADASIREWRASFIDLDGMQAPIDAHGTGDGGRPSGGVTITGPGTPGTYRLDAVAELDAGLQAEASWTIVVPDRDLPEDGLIDVPAPRLLLSAQGGTVAGWPGSGCHIYLCVDVGRLPPLRMVPSLDVADGENLTLRLSDDSGIVAWKVTLYPIVSGVQPALDEIGDEPDAPLAAFELPAPVAGEWLMQVEVTYDRLRGWSHVFYRLTSGYPAPTRRPRRGRASADPGPPARLSGSVASSPLR